MKKERTIQRNVHFLQKRADDRGRPRTVTNLPSGFNNPVELIHELQAHQVELERQNKKLHRSQQALMNAHISYTDLYDSAPVGYITADREGIILKANLTFADMVSAQRSSLLGRPLPAYILPGDRDIFYRHLKEVFHSKTRQVCELRMQKRNKSTLDVQLESTFPSDRGNTGDRYRIAVIDVTEQKQLEKDRQLLEARIRHTRKMESIYTVTGGVAHDFNNILQIIIGNVELAYSRIPPDDPVHTNLTEIQETAFKAADIVKILLSFSGHSDQDLRPMDTVAVIKESLNFLRPSIPAAIDLKTNLPDREIAVLADEVQIGRAIMNLCTNAVQAMEETGGTIEITVKTKSLTRETAADFPGLSKGDYMMITVKDTGPGIDPGVADQIFDPYFTTRGMGNCSGMGLAIVHGIVKNHNGVITVQTSPGDGTTFTILLPVTHQGWLKRTDTGHENLTGSETILFIDDDKFISQLAGDYLKILGYRVEAFLDPVKALAAFERAPHTYDVVITDMTMPEMNGVQLFEKLKAISPDVPVIISTGYSPLIDEKTAKAIGISDYLMKPVSMPEMVKSIRNVLNHGAGMEKESWKYR